MKTKQTQTQTQKPQASNKANLANLAAKIQGLDEQFRAHGRTQTSLGVRIGGYVIQVRRCLPGRQFSGWISDNLTSKGGYSLRHYQRLEKLAKAVEKAPDLLSLPITEALVKGGVIPDPDAKKTKIRKGGGGKGGGGKGREVKAPPISPVRGGRGYKARVEIDLSNACGLLHALADLPDIDTLVGKGLLLVPGRRGQ